MSASLARREHAIVRAGDDPVTPFPASDSERAAFTRDTRRLQELHRDLGRVDRERDRVERDLGREVIQMTALGMSAPKIALLLETTDYRVRRWREEYERASPEDEVPPVARGNAPDLRALASRRRAITTRYQRLCRLEARVDELELHVGQQLLRLRERWELGASRTATMIGEREHEIYRLREKAEQAAERATGRDMAAESGGS